MTKTEIIAREGWGKAAIFFTLFVFFEMMECKLLAFIFVVTFVLSLYLYRNLEREPQDYSEGVVIAPIDGEITEIKTLEDRVSVTLKNELWDSHILRAPSNGKIIEADMTKGYAFFSGEYAQKLNSRGSLKLKFKKHEILLEFFGKIFRDSLVVYTKKNGTDIKIGSRLGVLLSGETRISLPLNTRLVVDIGSKVIGGESAVAFIGK